MWWLLIQTAQATKTFMPPAATDVAVSVDGIYSFFLWASFVSCVLVIGGMMYFAFKYKRTPNTKSAYISHNNLLEFLWSFVPFLIFMALFVWGWIVYSQMRTFPEDSMEVAVQAQSWNWTFTYKNGRSTSGELVIPVDTPIKLVMSSTDVLHSFFVPAFRIKQDTIPGRYTAVWFQPKYKGEYQIFCTEFCGDQHSSMLAKLRVVDRAEFDEWLSHDPYQNLSMAEVGQKIFNTRCAVCHQTTDQRLVGPGLKGLFGSERKFADGTTTIADENYIRESILNPNAKIVESFPSGQMPTFAGQLDEQEMLGVIEYFKTLK